MMDTQCEEGHVDTLTAFILFQTTASPGTFHSGDGGEYIILSKARTGVETFLSGWVTAYSFMGA